MADTANGILKSKFLARYGPSRAGFNVRPNSTQAANTQRFWTNIDGTARPMDTNNVITKTTTYTLTPVETGSRVIFDSTTAFTITLPAPEVGLSYEFFIKQAAAATGHTVAVTGAGTKMYGKVSPTGAAAAATAAKGRTNTQATSTVGDGLAVWSDGTDWYSKPVGVWATQA